MGAPMEIANAKPVLIEWLDSRGVTPAWEFHDDVQPMPPCRCRSVGLLIEDTAIYKTLAMTVSDDQLVGRLTIPAKAIVKVKQLR